MSSLSTQWNWKVWRVVEADRVAAVRPRQLVDLQPLLRAADAARQADAHHEGQRRLQLLPAPLVADVAVVLLINAVELHQLVALERHSGGNPVDQVERDVPAKMVAVVLQPFVGAQLVERLRQVGAAVDVDRPGHHQPQ